MRLRLWLKQCCSSFIPSRKISSNRRNEVVHRGNRSWATEGGLVLDKTSPPGGLQERRSAMGRPKTAACTLEVSVEEIRNLPKVNKGSGGADPYAVLEILDSGGLCLVGGDRELYCKGCKTKVMKKSLDGYVNERFELGVHSGMVRGGAILRIRIMDFKPSPELPKRIAFVDVPLRELAEKGGHEAETRKMDLLALGEIVTTYGNKTAHGEVLMGYKNPTGTAFVLVTLKLVPPHLSLAEGVPPEAQLPAWKFHLMEPKEQDEYDLKMIQIRKAFEDEKEEQKRLELERLDMEQRARFQKRMETRVQQPTTRTNWRELQELMTNQLMRREWGYTMDKSSGVGGWRRPPGTGLQEVREEEAERRLVIKYLDYRNAERSEDGAVQDFVTKRMAEQIGEMTDHLLEWADPGGKRATELHPGSKSLGASVAHVLPTANLVGRRTKGPLQQRPESRGASRGTGEAEAGASQGGFEGGEGGLEWKEGRISGVPVSYLKPDHGTVGFEELKEAILLELTGGQQKNAWRDAVEIALQLSVTEVGMSSFFATMSQSNDRRQDLTRLIDDLRGEPGGVGDSNTCMLSKIDYEELVASLEGELEECLSNRPIDPNELVKWKIGVSYLEKLLEDADKNLEKTIRVREAARRHANTSDESTPTSRLADSTLESNTFSSNSSKRPEENIAQVQAVGLDGLRPDGSTLRDISVCRTPAATMTEEGLVFTAPAPGVGERRRWQVETVNGKDFLYPVDVVSGGAKSAQYTKRPGVQQIIDTSSGEQVKMIQDDCSQPRTRIVNMKSSSREIQDNSVENLSEHVYQPPGKEIWGKALKIAHGRRFREFDMMNDVRFLSMGGGINLSVPADRPRPDTSTTRLERTPMTNHVKITVHPDRPSGETIYMEARFAVFGKKKLLSAAILNAAIPPDGNSMFANHDRMSGKIALFDIPLTENLLSTDLGFVCARQAEKAGACAAMFILASDVLITAAGSNKHINPVGIPIFTIGKSQGDRLKDWIQPPIRFNPPYVTITTWTPEWLQSQPESGDGKSEAAGTKDEKYRAISNELVKKWREILSDDEEGRVWMERVRNRVERELGLEDPSDLKRGVSDIEKNSQQEEKLRTSEIFESASSRNELIDFGDDEEDGQTNFEVASMAARAEATFNAATGTMLKMTSTPNNIVEIRRGVALIISNATHLLPRVDGSSRDIPGLETDIRELEHLLPTLGFKVFPPQRNRNADEVWNFLRKVKRGFDAGGALTEFDSLAIFVTGHSNGQSIECAVDDAGQIGSIGIQLLMELFNDQNCPGLKGKLKLFVLGLSLGHPVHSPTTNQVGTTLSRTHNIMNSLETGGSAKVYKCISTFSELVTKDEWSQGVGGLLRDDNGEFQHHVSLSYRGVPYSGTFWRKKAAAGIGELIIDLGKVVVGIDTFSIFQQPFEDGKCTHMRLRYAKSEHVGDDPPDLSKDWEWMIVTDVEGNTTIPLYDKEPPTISSGSIMGPSRIFRTAPFSSRWLRMELKNDSTQGCHNGVGLRQIKAFVNPRSEAVPAHEPGKPTWIENPAEGVGGPALNRVGPDSVFPLYEMPVYAFAGKPKAIQGAIGLPADYSLLCYSVPVGGISDIPNKGSHLLSSLIRLLESAHHKHIFQDLLSDLLQGLVDDSCSRFGPTGYREQVRLLQKRCDSDDFPIMLSLGGGRVAVQGVPGHFDSVAGHRHYEDDVPEPRNLVRDAAKAQRSETSFSLPRAEFDLRFHPRLLSNIWDMKCGGTTLVKSGKGAQCVTALSLALPVTTQTFTWQFTIGTLAVLGGNSLSVPKLCIGVVAKKAARRLNLESYQLGDDADSWGLQTGSLAAYKNHAGSSQRLIGIRFSAGDVVTCVLDVSAGTLSMSVTGEEESIPPFTDLPVGGVIPAVSASGDTAVSVTIGMCKALPS